MLERAQGGDEALGYRSVLAAQQRDASAAYTQLQREYERTSTHLQSELAYAQEEVAERGERLAVQTARAEAGERLAATRAAETEEVRAALHGVDRQSHPLN